MKDLYRNRDFIPNFDELIAETAARSRAFAVGANARVDVPYGTGARERVDIIFPPGLAKGAPLHAFIHGGYWRAGNKHEHWLVAAPVLAAGGIAAFIGYDLMPDTRLQTQVASQPAATQLGRIWQATWLRSAPKKTSTQGLARYAACC